MSHKKVLIAAGGTGGHIYPALAIAEAFKRLSPGVVIDFVGTRHGLENKLVPAQGFKVHHLPIGRLNSNVSLGERILTVLRLPLAFLKSAILLKSEKPDLVVGVGGHASGPLLLTASLLGYRTAIWEPNAMPGLANRILSRFVDESFVVFPEAKKQLPKAHARDAGMPVRQEIESLRSSSASTEKPFHILIFGGSQGARSLNTAVAELITTEPEWAKNFTFVHQTGPQDFARIKAIYDAKPGPHPVELKDYLHDMAAQYQRADLVICRSGTGTLSELAACRKPAILVPFPFASDDHQRKNAESLVERGAAEMILHQNLSPQSLKAAIDDLRSDPARLKQMSEKIGEFHKPRAADTLVQQFLERMTDAPR